MIEISLTTALALYSIILALIVGIIFLYTELSVKRPQQHLGEQFLWRCTFCACTYLDESANPISQCPRCGSFNSLEDKSGPKNIPVMTPPDPQWASIGKGGSKRKRRGGKRGPRKRR